MIFIIYYYIILAPLCWLSTLLSASSKGPPPPPPRPTLPYKEQKLSATMPSLCCVHCAYHLHRTQVSTGKYKMSFVSEWVTDKASQRSKYIEKWFEGERSKEFLNWGCMVKRTYAQSKTKPWGYAIANQEKRFCSHFGREARGKTICPTTATPLTPGWVVLSHKSTTISKFSIRGYFILLPSLTPKNEQKYCQR